MTRRAALAAPWEPHCMDADEYAGWLALNGGSAAARHVAAARPCDDCSLGFAAEMRALGRCNGTPAVTEETDMDEQPQAPIGPQNRVPVAITPPPCASCIHEPVCSLRRAVVDMAGLILGVPRVADGLQVNLAAEVRCDHYRRDRTKPSPGAVALSPARLEAIRANQRKAVAAKRAAREAR